MSGPGQRFGSVSAPAALGPPSGGSHQTAGGGTAWAAGHSLRLVCPATVSWLAALVLLGCSATTGAVVAAGSASVALLIWATTRNGPPRLVSWRRAVGSGDRVGGRSRGPVAGTALAALACGAATAAVVAFKVHGVSTGPVVELAARRATVTAEVEIGDDPRVRPQRGGLTRRESVVVEARMVSIETGDGPSGGTPGARSRPSETRPLGPPDSVEPREAIERGESTDASGRILVDVPVVLLASGEGWSMLSPSQRIRVHGRLGTAERGDLTAAVLLVRGPPEVLSGPSAVQRAAGALRSGLREASDVLPQGARGLLPGLVVGDVSRLDEEIKENFTAAGLSHLTAVSGANLAFIAGAALVFARLVGLPLPARAILAVVAMGGFAVVARPSPSVVRALAMGVVAALAMGTGRSRDGVTALSATVLGLILFNPGLARQYGFALSVFATGGILVLAPRWRDRMASRMPRWAAEAIAVPAAAQVAVTPLLVLMSGQLGLVAIPANLLAGPAVAPATLLGFGAAIVAPLSMTVAQVLVRPAGLAAGWIIVVAERAAALPAATIGWPGGVPGLALLAVAVVLVWVVLRRRIRRYVVAVLLAGALVAALVIGPVTSPWPPPGWLLVACDVGQGDGMVLSTGPGSAVVIDTGPKPGDANRCLHDLGISRVPLLVLSHPHLDHVGGLAGVLRGRTVGAAVVSPGRVPQSESARVSVELRARRIPEWVVPPGGRWRFGGTEITVVSPEPDTPKMGSAEGAIANNASVVLLVRWSDERGTLIGSALLAGDLETAAQAGLWRRGVPEVDVLKVPHHGSSRQDPAFLSATRARAALISVGAGNDYGHPSPLTMARLHLLGMRTYRTDLSGDVAVIERAGRLAVVPRGK
ncbi:ComEC/Rec2 family competence protein [Microtetraspora sp. NBRC 16547]|uniref:ComEC/Rec2 family competence protein n=1 Tax=Microtetraspora sp. NBRC 16547 TaxID=3030993 RepID=UPI0024A437FF|nr:ComEC/Rec2 family competence protein [Microtetraspora sp. NBRC 16547]GLW97923.1 membrane protein [Microtetraspora sp. NBRC 16547]